MTHPEMPGGINELTEFVMNSSIVLVMCHGCKVPRPVNAEYAAYCVRGIRDCRFCRSQEE